MLPDVYFSKAHRSLVYEGTLLNGTVSFGMNAFREVRNWAKTEAALMVSRSTLVLFSVFSPALMMSQ
jgi:hypothetical protein